MSKPIEGIAWPLRTSRLTLRPATAADAATTWQFRRMDEVARWLTSAPATLDDHRRDFTDPASLAKTIIVEERGKVIGDLMLTIESAWAQSEVTAAARDVQAELGWVIDPGHRANGFGTEAVRALLQLCFGQLRLRRVTANCFADNTASWRLMDRVGMRREAHTIKDSLHRSGAWLDGYNYALLAEEWKLLPA